jgi:hypothetical protein
MTTTPIKVGIIGYGSSATLFHIPFIPFILPNPSLKLHAILQVATLRTTAVARMETARLPKFGVRGREGSFEKRGEDVQSEQLVGVEEEGFGMEPERDLGCLTRTGRGWRRGGAESEGELCRFFS